MIKLNRIIASMIALSMITGYSLNVNAKELVGDKIQENVELYQSIENDSHILKNILDDGNYTITNQVLKIGTTQNSAARQYVEEESQIKVENGKYILTINIKDIQIMSNIGLTLNGESREVEVIKGDSKSGSISFEINSLNDEIIVSSTISITSFMKMNVDFNVVLDKTTLKDSNGNLVEEPTVTPEEKPDESPEEKPNENPDEIPEQKPEEIPGEEDSPSLDEPEIDDNINNGNTGGNAGGNINNGGSSDNSSSYTRDIYKVKNQIITDSAIGYQAARGALSEYSYYEVYNNDKYITLGFTQMDLMNNISVKVDGYKINYDVINKTSNNLEIKFKVASINSDITVSANISAIGREISFGVKLLESSMQLVSSEKGEGTSTKVESLIQSLGNSNTEDLTLNNLEVESEELVEESIDAAEEAKEYFKKYTISNEIVSDSAIGKKMARKYLNETSLIEEIDGKLYGTVTFNSASSMSNYKIEVNGENISYTVPLKDEKNDLISLRFPIDSISDDIKVYIHINSVNMDISFGIRFLEETMTLIDEGVINSVLEDEDLTKTLSAINENAPKNENNSSTIKIIMISVLVTLLVNNLVIYLIILARKKKKVKSDK